MKPIVPSSNTNKFPACTSAWKISLEATLKAQVLKAEINVFSGLFENLRMPSRSINGTPTD
jgi:hypothetical protein